MGRINQYQKASAINGNDTLLGVVGGTTKQVTKDILLSGVTKDIGNTTIVGKKAGKVVTANDSSHNRLTEITAYGKSVQNTYSGENLFNNTAITYTFNGITFTVNADKSITVNGTASDNSTYTIGTVGKLGEIRLIGSPQNANKSYLAILKNKSWSNAITENGNGVNATLTDDVNSVVIAVPKGETVSNLVFKPMITSDLNATYDDYEPYVGGEASPNPSYPQDITSVAYDNNLVVKSCGRNLATYDNNLAVNSDNELYYNNTVASGVTKVNGSEKWYIHCNNYSLLNGGLIRLSFTKEYPKSGASVVSRLNVSKNGVITIPENIEYMLVCASSADGTLEQSISALAEVMVAKSDVAIPYEPYKTPTEASLTLADSLRGIPVASGGNYVDEDGQAWICDTIEKRADGTGKLIKRIDKVVADGINVKTTYKSGTASDMYMIHIGNSVPAVADNVKGNLMCSHFVANTFNNLWYGAEGISLFRENGGQFRISFSLDRGINTIDLCNEWLQENNITIYYELAEPMTASLSADQVSAFELLHSFEPYTTVYTDDMGEVAITYFKNSDSGNIVGSLNDRISNLVALLQSNGVI